jgi:hypothetical protein
MGENFGDSSFSGARCLQGWRKLGAGRYNSILDYQSARR